MRGEEDEVVLLSVSYRTNWTINNSLHPIYDKNNIIGITWVETDGYGHDNI